MNAKLLDLAEPLRHPAFRRLWVSGLLSQLGDWAARLALSVLVFDRTHSAFAAAAALAVSVLPWLGPGQWLTALTERWPRRRVMVTADVVRAVIFVLAAGGPPVPVLFALVFLAGLATPAFEAGRSSIMPELLPGPVFASSLALRGMTDDATLIGGYLLGGALLAVLSPQGALLVNAAAFAISALLIIGLPPGAAPANDETGSAQRLIQAAKVLLRTPHLRRAAASVTLAIAGADTLIVLAVPRVVGELHRGPIAVSWLVALACTVTITTTLLIPHRVDSRRLMTIVYALLATGGLGSAIVLLLAPGLAGMALAFATSGLLAVVMVPANIVVSTHLPATLRASAMSILMGALCAAQAAVPVIAGAAADVIGVVPVCAAVFTVVGSYGAFTLLRPVRLPQPAAGGPPAPSGLCAPSVREPSELVTTAGVTL